MVDPLAPLLKLQDIESAVDGARSAVDGAYKHWTLRRKGGEVAAEVSLRAAVASAALSSHGYAISDVRAGTVLDPVVQGALRVAEALPGLSERWQGAPRQVLAKLHVLAGTGVLPVEQLGRPQTSVDRPCEFVTGKFGEPLIRAAVVYGELLALDAFAGVNGIVARAAARLTLVASGFDPRGLVGFEAVELDREPEYLGASGAFATGTPDGMRSWLKHFATSVTLGAESVAAIADEVGART